LDELRIIHSVRSKSDLEEASSAYKDISQVMAFQSDLVKIKVELSPLAIKCLTLPEQTGIQYDF
jgi:tRNA-splicing ligase RtcB